MPYKGWDYLLVYNWSVKQTNYFPKVLTIVKLCKQNMVKYVIDEIPRMLLAWEVDLGSCNSYKGSNASKFLSQYNIYSDILMINVAETDRRSSGSDFQLVSYDSGNI